MEPTTTAPKAEASGANPSGNRLFVGNLSYSTNSESLQQHMSSAGEVIYAQVMLRHDGKSKGCGIVEYATQAEAQSAVEILHDSVLDSRKIFVREDREDASKKPERPTNVRLFVGNVPPHYRWGQLKDLFKPFDQVIHADVFYNRFKDQAHGVVTIKSEEGAQRAIKSLDGTDLEGFKIIVRKDRH